MGKFVDVFSDDEERKLLSLFVTTPYADVFGVYDTLLPPEQFATLGAAYSRTHECFQSRLVRAIAEGDLLEPELVRQILGDPTSESTGADLPGTIEHFRAVPKKAGAFIRKWAQEYGHNSIKEMGMLRFCCENIPDYTGKHITGHPLAHPQVKSSRYIDWTGLLSLVESNRDIHTSRHAEEILSALGQISNGYEELSARCAKFLEQAPINNRWLESQISTDAIRAALEKRSPGKCSDQDIEREIELRREGLRKDCRRSIFDTTRYLLTPAMPTSLACAIDARSAEDVLTSLLSSPLKEDIALGETLWAELKKVQPVLLGEKCHAGKNDFAIALRTEGRALCQELFEFERKKHFELTPRTNFIENVQMFSEAQLAASLVYPYGHGSFNQYYQVLTRDKAACSKIFERLLTKRGKFDGFPEELGQGGAMREFLMDYGGYRDVFRHRRGYKSRQLLSTYHGFETPQLIPVSGLQEDYNRINTIADQAFKKVVDVEPEVAQLLVTFAHRCRSLYSWSVVQDLYFVELRGKPTANESYRTIAFDIAQYWQKSLPDVWSHVRFDTRNYPAELTLLARKWYDGSGSSKD